MTVETHNKDLIRRLFQAADQDDLREVMSFFSPGFIDYNANDARRDGESDCERARRAFQRFAAAFSDTRHTLHDVLAEGDRVVVRVSAVGTHTGRLVDHPPTGRRVRTESIAIYRMEGGKIAERWCQEDRGVLEQLRGSKGEEE